MKMNIKMFYYYKTRWVRNKLFKNYNIRPNLGFNHFERLYKRFYKIRKPLIQQIISDYNIRDKHILDLCSGFGQDDILFTELGNNKVISVDINKPSCEFHKQKIRENGFDNKIYNGNMTRIKFNNKFDIIYTANPGNWTNENVSIIIPKYCLKTVKRNSKDGTLFICILNSGNYHFNTELEVLDYMKLFRNKISSIGFVVLDYKRINNTNENGLLIVSVGCDI